MGGNINRRVHLRLMPNSDSVSPVEKGRGCVNKANLNPDLTARIRPHFSVRNIDANAPTIRIFARNNKNPLRVSLISSNTAGNHQFNGCELLTLNGIDDSEHLFATVDPSNTRHFFFTK